MKAKLIWFFLFLTFFGSYSTLWAASSNQTITPGFGGFLSLLLIITCVTRRKYAIGGWLLYFFIQLYLAVLVRLIVTTIYLHNYNPFNWEDISQYSLYCLSTIPTTLILIAQGVIAVFLISKKHRFWSTVNIFRLALLADMVFNMIAIPIDLALWPDAVVFSILGLIWPLIWLPYFSFSKRVKSIYLLHDWLEPIKKQKVEPLKKPIHNTIHDGSLPYCPECHAEYVTGVRECKDCRVPLVNPGDEDIAITQTNLGISLAEAGKYEEAEKEYNEALKIKPELVEAHYSLACCYALWGKTNEAITCLRAAVEKGFDDWPHMERDDDLNSLKQDPWFKVLTEIVKKRWEVKPKKE